MNHVSTELYPSRTDGMAGLKARQEPVVYGGGTYASALAPGQVASYERQGFLVLHDLFSSQEVQALLAEVDRLAADPAIRGRDETITEKGSDEVRSIFRVHALSQVMDRLVRDPRVLDVARQLLGSEVYLHQSRINMKPGFKGKEFYWHSDFETWHVEDGMPHMRALSCSVLLTDNYASNGPLMLVPGSHRQFVSCPGRTPDDHYKASLKKQEYGVPDPLSLELLVEQGGIETVVADAGSVVFFDCNTMHGSAGNITPWPRANAFFVYNSVENRLDPPKYGLSPRPDYIAAREQYTETLKPA